MNTVQKLNLVVSHKLEAKPLIEMLGLKKNVLPQPQPQPYQLYENDQGVCLIISGMGRVASAAAVDYLKAMQRSEQGVGWLNIGIAGHQSAEVGSGFLAHKITEYDTGRNYYPAKLIPGFDTTDVITVDEPEADYPKDAAYEMEASGFFAAACRAITSELVQTYKVISDNSSYPVHDIDLALVGKLIRGRGEEITRLLSGLSELVGEYNASYQLHPEFDLLMAKARFTVTQQSQLKRLCQRFYALNQEQLLLAWVASSIRSSRQLIKEMESELSNLSEAP